MRGTILLLVAAVFLSCSNSGAGTSCSVTDNGDGTKTISCPDGTSATLRDGAPSSCSVRTNPDAGSKTISCTDGTTVTVRDGDAWSVRLEAELPGANCANGGTQVLSGPDTNGNGMLEVPNEVQSTAYVCGAPTPVPCITLEGTLTIRNSIDWANFIAAGCTMVTGELVIDAPGLSSLTPSATNLTSVGGLRISNNTRLSSVSFPALVTVDGELDLSGNVVLTSVSLPLLKTVNGDVRVRDNDLLPSFTLPALATASGLAQVTRNAALTSLSLPGVTTAGGLVVFNNPRLSTLDASLLESVSELGVEITALTSLSFPALATAGSTTISTNSALTNLSLPALRTTSDLLIDELAALTTLSLPVLATTAGFELSNTFALTNVSLPMLATVNGIFDVNNNVGMVSLNVPLLRTVPSLIIQRNDVFRQCLADAIRAQLTPIPTNVIFFANTGTPNVCP